MPNCQATIRKLVQDHYFDSETNHQLAFFLTKEGRRRYEACSSPQELGNFYYEFLTYLPYADACPSYLGLIACAYVDVVAGNPAFAYGKWPECFEVKANPLLKFVTRWQRDPSLELLLSYVSNKSFKPLLTDPAGFVSGLEPPNADGTYSPLGRLERELVVGYLETVVAD
jgi:hypothetical protein